MSAFPLEADLTSRADGRSKSSSAWIQSKDDPSADDIIIDTDRDMPGRSARIADRAFKLACFEDGNRASAGGQHVDNAYGCLGRISSRHPKYRACFH